MLGWTPRSKLRATDSDDGGRGLETIRRVIMRLVTGASGFVGRHLVAARCRRPGAEVVGLAQSTTFAIPYHAIDLLDTKATEAVIRQTRPEWLFHLAGYANAGARFRDSEGMGRQTLAREACTRRSASRQFGRESCSFPTGSSTAMVWQAGRPSLRTPRFDPTRLRGQQGGGRPSQLSGGTRRARHHSRAALQSDGPGQASQYAAANFARPIAAVELRNVPPVLRTGDLTPQRDLTDVRDMVQAYIRLMEVGKKGDVYNAGSGTTVVVHDLLMRLLALSAVEVTIEQQADASRFGDTSVSRADTAKLRTVTGWQPSYSLDQSLHDILADWRSRTSKTSP